MDMTATVASLLAFSFVLGVWPVAGAVQLSCYYRETLLLKARLEALELKIELMETW
jgi:hypothetical protein